MFSEIFYSLTCRYKRYDLGPVGVFDLGLSPDESLPCENSGGPALAALFRQLSIAPGSRLLDIGAGKAGAILTLSRFPFSRIDGVEISPFLSRIAIKNLERAELKDRCQIYCSDAADFNGYAGYDWVFMYNPFKEKVMHRVLEKLARAVEDSRKPMAIVYQNPQLDEMVVGSGTFGRILRYRAGGGDDREIDHRTYYVYQSVVQAEDNL